MTFAPSRPPIVGVLLEMKGVLVGTHKKVRTGRRVAVAILTVGGVVLAWLVLLPRMLRRNRSLLSRQGPVGRLVKTYNNWALHISGTRRSSWGLLTHVGRRSGRTYQTSLGTHPYGDGLLLPLGYGTRTDWYRNVMAAEECTVAWKGRTYHLRRPELISGPEAMQAWPIQDRILLRLSGIHDFVWLHHVEPQSADSPPIRSPR